MTLPAILAAALLLSAGAAAPADKTAAALPSPYAGADAAIDAVSTSMSILQKCYQTCEGLQADLKRKNEALKAEFGRVPDEFGPLITAKHARLGKQKSACKTLEAGMTQKIDAAQLQISGIEPKGLKGIAERVQRIFELRGQYNLWVKKGC